MAQAIGYQCKIARVLQLLLDPILTLLGPGGQLKSTVLGLYTAWAIGIHTHGQEATTDPLPKLYG